VVRLEVTTALFVNCMLYLQKNLSKYEVHVKGSGREREERVSSFLSLMLLHLDPVCIPAGLDGSGINDEWKWTDEGDVSNKLE
jgi:hypothetical protein